MHHKIRFNCNKSVKQVRRSSDVRDKERMEDEKYALSSTTELTARSKRTSVSCWASGNGWQSNTAVEKKGTEETN